MQLLCWRDALDDAGNVVAVQALETEVNSHRQAALVALQHTLDDAHDFAAAAGQVRALMFVERFAHDVDQRLEALGQ